MLIKTLTYDVRCIFYIGSWSQLCENLFLDCSSVEIYLSNNKRYRWLFDSDLGFSEL